MLDLSNVWPELKVIEKLGEGSFGKVYKCEREELGMKLYNAVKVISIPANKAEYDSVRKECQSDAEVKSYYGDIVADFSNEIKLMLMLKGAPNVVSVENFRIVEHADGIGSDIYICMEYLTCFSAYSAAHTIDEKEVLRLGKEISNALSICAAKGIIHRDIKPDNIFVDSYGSYKLGDFGVARRLEGSMSMMSKKGTYSYMAPEVFRGEKYDSRADIYSLGMVMYKLLNRNREPFVDLNKSVVGYNDRSEAIERRRSGERLPAPVDASPAVAAVILKACAFNPNDRYASVAQFKQALADVAEAIACDEATVADTSDNEKTVVAAGVGLYSSQKAQSDINDTTLQADGDEETTVAVAADRDATLVADHNAAAVTPDPEATMKADTAYNKPANDSDKVAKPAEKEPKSKKKAAIFAAAILVVLAVVAIVAIMSKGGFSKEKSESKNNAAQLQAEHTDDFYENGEDSGEPYHTVTNPDETETANTVTDTVEQITEAVTVRATEASSEGKTEVVAENGGEVPTKTVITLPTKPEIEATTKKKTEATTKKPSTTKKQETTTKKKPVTTKAPTTKAPETTKAPVSKYDSVSIGDYITFGSYEQDNNTSNGKETIEWIVLDKKDGKVLVISKYALDCQPYNEDWGDVTWETCTLRKWLNNAFLNTAFTSSEREMIPTVTTIGMMGYNNELENDTKEKIFLLEFGEAGKHLDFSDWMCKPTKYAEKQGCLVNEGHCRWWFRSAGANIAIASNVEPEAGMSGASYKVNSSGIAVRPAMWITL